MSKDQTGINCVRCYHRARKEVVDIKSLLTHNWKNNAQKVIESQK